MNWFVSKFRVTVTAADDRCPHLQDGDVAYHRSTEMDSFGPVGRFCSCEACYKEAYETRPVAGGDWILEAVRSAVKARVGRYDVPNSEEQKFLAAVANATAIGFKLVRTMEPAYYGNFNPEAPMVEVYRPWFRVWSGEGWRAGLDDTWTDPETMMHFNYGCEWLHRLGEQLAQLVEFVEFDNPAGLFQLSPHVGYTVSADGVFDFQGAPVAKYKWTHKKPESFEVRPLRDYEIVRCNDCKQDKFKYLTGEWRWYDFYAPQGDEALIICDCCWKLTRHQRRLAEDRAAFNAEMGIDDQDDYPEEDDIDHDAIEDKFNTDDLSEDAEAAYVESDPMALSTGLDHAKTLESAKAYLQQRQADLTKLKVMLWDNQNMIAPGWELRRYTDGSICVCSVIDGEVDWAVDFASVEQSLAYILARWW